MMYLYHTLYFRHSHIVRVIRRVHMCSFGGAAALLNEMMSAVSGNANGTELIDNIRVHMYCVDTDLTKEIFKL